MPDKNLTFVNWPEAGQSLHALIGAQCLRTPGAIALRFKEQCLTYGQLELASSRLAQRLVLAGVPVAGLVGVAMNRSLELVVALLGSLKAGAAYIPLDPDLPEARFVSLVEDAAPSVVLTLSEHELPDSAVPVIVVDLADLLGQRTEGAAMAALPVVQPTSPAYALFTSGSTGAPKAAINSHEGIVNRLLWMQSAYPISAKDVVLQKTPFTFDVSVWEFFWPLMQGATLEIVRPGGHLDMAHLHELINLRSVTVAHFVPTMLRLFLEQSPDGWQPGLRYLICSGEQLPLDLMRDVLSRWPRTALHNLYGPAECAVDVTAWDCRANAHSDRVLIGHPVANTRIHLLDESGQPVPDGEVGELWIAGVQVGLGYLNRPELTAERFVVDTQGAPEPGAMGTRMYRTGDLARWHAGQGIEYLGRTDFQVKLGGVRIELGEIETAMLRCPEVKDAAVVLRGVAGAEHLVAVAIPVNDAVLSDTSVLDHESARIRAQLALVLPGIMVPAKVYFRLAMPLTSSGKTDRRELSAWLDAQSMNRSQDAAQTWSDPLRALVAQAWQLHLPIGPTTAEQSFFECGGGSLHALKVAATLTESSGRQVSPGWIYRFPRLSDQAAKLLDNPLRRDEASWGPLGSRVIVLSEQQEMLLLAGLMEPSGAAMLVHVPLLLDASCSLPRVKQAFNWLLDRHPLLRTEVHLVGDVWQTNTQTSMPAEWWREAGVLATPPAGLEWPPHVITDMCRTLGGDVVQPCRFDVWRVSDGRSLLIWTVHHFAIDEAATDLCLAEVHEWLSDRSVPAAADSGLLAAYERAHIDVDGIQQTALQVLGADRPEALLSIGQSGASHDAIVPLDAALCAGLTQMASNPDSSIFSALLCAYGSALQSIWGASAQHVLTPFSRRAEPGVAEAVGYCLDVRLIQAGRLAGETVDQQLQRVRASTLEAMAPSFQPLHRVAAVVSQTDPSCARTLGAFCLTWRQMPARSVPMGGGRADLLLYPHRGSKFGVTLHAATTPDGWHVYIEALDHLHESGVVDQLISAFQRALAEVLALPTACEEALDKAMTSAASRASVLPQRSHSPVDGLAAQAWRAVLGLPPDAEILGSASFFSQGGGSLAVIRLAAEVRRLTGRNLPVAAFMQDPTAWQLCELIGQSGGANVVQEIASIAGGDVLWVGPADAASVVILVPGYMSFSIGMQALAEAIVASAPSGTAVAVPDLMTLVEAVQPGGNGSGTDMVRAVVEAIHNRLMNISAERIVGVAGYSLGGQLAMEWCQLAGLPSRVPLILLDTYPPDSWTGRKIGRYTRGIRQRFWRWWDGDHRHALSLSADQMVDLDKPADTLISTGIRARWQLLDQGLKTAGVQSSSRHVHLLQAGHSMWYAGLLRGRATNGFQAEQFASLTVYRLPLDHLAMPKRGRWLVASVVAGVLRSF